MLKLSIYSKVKKIQQKAKKMRESWTIFKTTAITHKKSSSTAK
jgi:hypothetical protein